MPSASPSPTPTPSPTATASLTATPSQTAESSAAVLDVRIVGWDADTGAVLDIVTLSLLAFGVVVVALLVAASLTIVTRRGT